MTKTSIRYLIIILIVVTVSFSIIYFRQTNSIEKIPEFDALNTPERKLAIQNIINIIQQKFPNHRFFDIIPNGEYAIFSLTQSDNARTEACIFCEESNLGIYLINQTTGDMEKLFIPKQWNDRFRIALSADGLKLLTTQTDGSIILRDIITKEIKNLGTFKKNNESQYWYPVYSPDGKYIFLADQWNNTLTVLSAENPSLEDSQVFENYWIEDFEFALTPRAGIHLHQYQFLPNGKTMFFSNHEFDLRDINI
ncbi:MAG: hypothetical protein WC894_04695 [Patescibacteria group bacterium]